MSTGFRFQAYVTLKRRLGEYDAIVEFTELAVRDLLNRDELAVASSKHGIRVDSNQIFRDSLFVSRRTQFYILSVYQQAELFIDELLEDLPQGREWKESSNTARRDDEAQLTWLLRAMKTSGLNDFSDGFAVLVSLFDYYRLVRNAFMHEGQETRALSEKYRKLGEVASNIADMELSFPKKYDQLDFNDFLSFTRVVKSIAIELCKCLKPDLPILIKHCFSRSHYGLKQYLGNDERFARACITLLQRRFNLTVGEIQYLIPDIRKLVMVASTR